jgi:hypothetical protein
LTLPPETKPFHHLQVLNPRFEGVLDCPLHSRRPAQNTISGEKEKRMRCKKKTMLEDDSHSALPHCEQDEMHERLTARLLASNCTASALVPTP